MASKLQVIISLIVMASVLVATGWQARVMWEEVEKVGRESAEDESGAGCVDEQLHEEQIY